MNDHDQRERIRSDLDSSLIVEAAAGTGKTTELVARMIRVLAEGRARMNQLVAVTFTEKAAGELKLRLRSELERTRARTEDLNQRENLGEALAHLEEAQLNTIHGFCLDLLRERPVEAGVDPGFQPMDDAESERLYGEAFDAWMQKELDRPREGVRRALRRKSFGIGGEAASAPADRLRQAGWDLLQWRDLPGEWRRDVFDRQASVDALVAQIREYADLTGRACPLPVRLFRDAEAAAERTRLSNSPQHYDDLEARLVELARDRGLNRPPTGLARLKRQVLTEAHEKLTTALKAFARAADADLAALLRNEIWETLDAYNHLKAERGRLDFLDLLLLARDLIRDKDAVRAAFQKRFTHLFVDEFQDTDPLQAEILLLLVANDPHERDWHAVTPVAGKLFLVGDPKQAIYRFRRADVGVYQEVKTLLCGRGVVHLTLTTSFRATPAIQSAVNFAFGPLMDGNVDTLQAGYVPLAHHRADPEGQPSLVALSVPSPYGKTRFSEASVEACLPETIGGFIEWMIRASGWTVEESGQRVPAAARHVCLLFRKTSGWFDGDITRAYVQALEARGIPHLLVGGKTFHSREEIETLRAALAAVEWPDDELSVYATLRGSLFAISDEILLEYRDAHGRLHPFRQPKKDVQLPDRLRPVIETLELLRTLHRGRNQIPVAATVDRLLCAARAHAALVLRPSGEQVLANVLQVAELARQYEERGGISFRGFVERLNEEAERGEAAEAPILEEGSDGVRLMTVHKAKGLEFPVVILADATTKLARKEAARFLDKRRGVCAVRIAGWSPAELLEHEQTEIARDNAEGVRLAYVAATRARDLLVVPAIGDDPREKWEGWERWWIAPLHAAIYPPAALRRMGLPAAGCPPFGDDSVETRPQDDQGVQRERDATNIAPGLHVWPGSHAVTWWDPHLLPRNAREQSGLRHRDLLSKDADPAMVARDLENHRQWFESRSAAIAAGSAPSLRVERVTAASRDRAASVAGIEVISIGRAGGGPAGRGFGSLVHAVIASTLSTQGASVASIATMQARVLGCTPEEAAAAANVVESALAHPFFQRVRSSPRVRRETPVTHRQSDGTLLEGVVDLAFEEDGAWVVADFKTDREIEDRLDDYRRQVSLYAVAVAAATGQPARGVLVRL
jgi:ATP-dependent helicase/nuclease subunit A